MINFTGQELDHIQKLLDSMLECDCFKQQKSSIKILLEEIACINDVKILNQLCSDVLDYYYYPAYRVHGIDPDELSRYCSVKEDISIYKKLYYLN